MDAEWWMAAAAVVGVLLIPIGWLGFALSKSKDEVAALRESMPDAEEVNALKATVSDQKAVIAGLEAWKDEHRRADIETHGRLEKGDEEVLRELKAFRDESSRQHGELSSKLLSLIHI